MLNLYLQLDTVTAQSWDNGTRHSRHLIRFPL